MATLYNDGPLCGPFPIFNTLPEFSDYTLDVSFLMTTQYKASRMNVSVYPLAEASVGFLTSFYTLNYAAVN